MNKDIDRKTQQCMIPKLKEEIALLRKKIELQENSEIEFMKYCRFGIPLLSNLSGFTRVRMWKFSKSSWVRYSLEICIFGKVAIEPPIEPSTFAFLTEKQQVRK